MFKEINGDIKTRTAEISIRDVFWSILSHWRLLVLVTLIIGILCGSYKLVEGVIRLGDQETNQKAEDAYKTALENYNTEKALLTSQIDFFEKEINKKKHIYENSLLFKIDPHNAYKAVLSYYVDTGYSVNPNTTVQNINHTSSIVSSYNSRIRNLNLDALLAETEEANLITANPVDDSSVKIVNSNTDAANGLLSITVLAESSERLDFWVASIKEVMATAKADISKTIMPHELMLISQYNWQEIVESSLTDLSVEYFKGITALEDSVADAKKARSALVKPVSESVSKKGILKSIIVFGLLGGAAAFLFSFFLLALRYFSGNHIVSEADLFDRYGLPVLGVLNKQAQSSRRLDHRIDACVWRKRGFFVMSGEDQEAVIEKRINLYVPNAESILLLSSGGVEFSNDASRVLVGERLKRNYHSGGYLLLDANAQDALQQADGVVMVEGIETGLYSDIDRQFREVQQAGKEIAGFIIVI